MLWYVIFPQLSCARAHHIPPMMRPCSPATRCLGRNTPSESIPPTTPCNWWKESQACGAASVFVKDFPENVGWAEVKPNVQMLLLGDVSIAIEDSLGQNTHTKTGKFDPPDIYDINRIIPYHISYIIFHISYIIIYHISLYHIISHSIPQCRIWVLMTFYAVRSKDSDAAGSNFMAAQLLGNASLQVDLHVSFGRCCTVLPEIWTWQIVGVSNNNDL